MTTTEKIDHVSSLWQGFSAVFLEIYNFKNAIPVITDLGQKHYRKQKEIGEKVGTGITSVNALYFYNLFDGLATPIGGNQNTYDDMIRITVEHHNRQYKWVLVEAYEYFEDLIENLFSFLVYIDRSELTVKEREILGEMPNDISLNDFYAKLNNLRILKDPEKLLNRIRNYFPEIIEIENKNGVNKHVRFEITMISKFRHVIVHQRGKIKDYDKFKALVFNAAGIPMENKEGKALQEYLGAHVQDNGMIIMEEHHFRYDGLPLIFTKDRLQAQINILIAYSHLICVQMINKLNPSTQPQ